MMNSQEKRPSEPELSIVVPVYYNEDTLLPLYCDLKEKVLDRASFECEIILVDDGSRDKSWAAVRELCALDSRVRGFRLSRNFGSHAAILCGLNMSRGRCAVVKAADLQEPSELIFEMYEMWRRGNNVVLAVRQGRADGSLFTRLYYRMTRDLALPTMPLAGFDVYLVDRAVIKVLGGMNERNSALTGQILWSGFKTAYVYYERLERTAGKSRWTLKKKIRLVADTLFSFTTVPISFVSIIGALACFGSLAWALYVLINKLVGNIPVEGYTTLFIFQLFSFGIIMLTLGILGGYLWRSFDASRERPVYIVEDEAASAEESDKNGEAPALSQSLEIIADDEPLKADDGALSDENETRDAGETEASEELPVSPPAFERLSPSFEEGESDGGGEGIAAEGDEKEPPRPELSGLSFSLESEDLLSFEEEPGGEAAGESGGEELSSGKNTGRTSRPAASRLRLGTLLKGLLARGFAGARRRYTEVSPSGEAESETGLSPETGEKGRLETLEPYDDMPHAKEPGALLAQSQSSPGPSGLHLEILNTNETQENGLGSEPEFEQDEANKNPLEIESDLSRPYFSENTASHIELLETQTDSRSPERGQSVPAGRAARLSENRSAAASRQEKRIRKRDKEHMRALLRSTPADKLIITAKIKEKNEV
ncbi:MAG: glycosyltransferase [Oscillospiraceae bacterium]|nr:glycosyltransferase [Oscillospiraceae bacterium]